MRNEVGTGPAGSRSELLVCLRRFSTQVSGGNGRKGGRPEIRHRGLREDRTSASVKAAAVEEEEKFEPWEGFQGDLARWGRDTAFGLAAGFVFGGVKGLRDNVHLQGKFGPGESSVYRGIKYSFRVPLNYIQASIASASWGFRVGFFTSAFSAFSIYVQHNNGAPVPAASPQSVPPPKSAEGFGGGLEVERIAAAVLPFSAAGTAVGGIYGWFRGQGALRSTLAGGVLGLVLTSSLKGLEFYLTATLLPDVERKLQELREEEARRRKK